tara:strand:+ start:3693 stop:4667 length:975 start_codon:yes stop_codon:yes gene_type:complete
MHGTNNSSTKNICVIGGGNWGQNHIKTLHSLNCLAGVVDSDESVINVINKVYPTCKVFSNVDDALGMNFDGYIIATGPSSHYSLAKKIIFNKKHLLIEKPMTLNTSDAKELCDLADDNKVKLMVGHLLLFHPAFNKMKEMCSRGDIGDLQYMYSNRLNYGTIRSNENVFWSFAPHDVSLFQYYAESNPQDISSTGIDIIQPGIHDSTITTIKYENGIMGHIYVSWIHPFKEHRFVLIGSKGMLYFEDSKKEKPLLFFSKNINFDGPVPVAEDKSSSEIKYEFQFPLTEQLKYFIDCIGGKDVNVASGQSGLEVINILEKASSCL